MTAAIPPNTGNAARANARRVHQDQAAGRKLIRAWGATMAAKAKTDVWAHQGQ
jgi:hypothetical protein